MTLTLNKERGQLQPPRIFFNLFQMLGTITGYHLFLPENSTKNVAIVLLHENIG